MPINPSFTGNRHLIPRDQLHELAKKVNARIQAEKRKSAPVQQRPPANTRATIPLVRPIIRELLTRSIVARDKKSILDASLRRLHSSINTTTTTKE